MKIESGEAELSDFDQIAIKKPSSAALFATERGQLGAHRARHSLVGGMSFSLAQDGIGGFGGIFSLAGAEVGASQTTQTGEFAGLLSGGATVANGLEMRGRFAV